VRLIRSKGIGVYFVTQNPLDVPDSVLGQLGNRVQHALRAFTPRDGKAVKAAADTFRQNPAFDAAAAIKELGVGEALVSMLAPDGTPEIVERCWIAPPDSRVGPVTPEERQRLIEAGPIYGKYDTPLDRESAFEILAKRAGRSRIPAVASSAQAEPIPAPRDDPWSRGAPPTPQTQPHGPWGQSASSAGPAARAAPPQVAASPPASAPPSPAAGQGVEPPGGLLGGVGGLVEDWWNGGGSTRGRMTNGQLVVRSAVQSASRSVGTQVAREIMRGVLGGLQR